MRSDTTGFRLDDRTKKALGGVTPSFGLSRFGNAGGTSRSGHERNRLFLSEFPERRQFLDVSGISGTDSTADGRAVAFWDYDRDGWVDMAVVNANAPLLEVFRNRLGDAGLVAAKEGNMLAVRVLGGNRMARASSEWSARDAYGAQITVSADELRMFRELHAGEGLAAQNSRTTLFGLGAATAVDVVRVRWPSGRLQEATDVPAGSLVTLFEDASESPDGSGFSVEPYVRAMRPPTPDVRTEESARFPLSAAVVNGDTPSRLLMYTTMTTTCASCLAELPELGHLRASLDSSQLAMLAVPTDEEDSVEELRAWAQARKPAYELLLDLEPELVASVRSLVIENLKRHATPATIVTDPEGRILLMRFGAPTLSELRSLLD